MIPREILKKIRQIELRTNRIVTAAAAACACLGIPTGFRPKAQGCDAGATLGIRPQNVFNRDAVAAIPSSPGALGICHNPVGVGGNKFLFTQGSSFLATLGCMPESLWDSPTAAKPAHADSPFIISTPTRLRQPV